MRRVGPQQRDRVRVPVARPGRGDRVVGAEQQDRRRRREQAALVRRQRAARVLRQPLVRFRDAATEDEIAEHGPGEEEGDDQDERDRQLAAPADLPRAAGRRLRPGAPVAAAPVALRPSGEGATSRAGRPSAPGPSCVRPGRRGRASLRRVSTSGGVWYPRVLEQSRVIGVDVGGTKILAAVVSRDGLGGRAVERPSDHSSQEALLDGLDSIGRGAARRRAGCAGDRLRHPFADRPARWSARSSP